MVTLVDIVGRWNGRSWRDMFCTLRLWGTHPSHHWWSPRITGLFIFMVTIPWLYISMLLPTLLLPLVVICIF